MKEILEGVMEMDPEDYNLLLQKNVEDSNLAQDNLVYNFIGSQNKSNLIENMRQSLSVKKILSPLKSKIMNDLSGMASPYGSAKQMRQSHSMGMVDFNSTMSMSRMNAFEFKNLNPQ